MPMFASEQHIRKETAAHPMISDAQYTLMPNGGSTVPGSTGPPTVRSSSDFSRSATLRGWCFNLNSHKRPSTMSKTPMGFRLLEKHREMHRIQRVEEDLGSNGDIRAKTNKKTWGSWRGPLVSLDPTSSPGPTSFEKDWRKWRVSLSCSELL